jgi:hypothetical protein
VRKILVTGAAIFIGFHPSRRLLARRDYVVGLDNLNHVLRRAVEKGSPQAIRTRSVVLLIDQGVGTLDIPFYTPHQLLDLLKRHLADRLIYQLRSLKLRHQTESKDRLWQEGNQPKHIDHDPMMWQNVEYIHNNPLQRGFVDEPIPWRWSGTRSYAQHPGLVEIVTDWM